MSIKVQLLVHATQSQSASWTHIHTYSTKIEEREDAKIVSEMWESVKIPRKITVLNPKQLDISANRARFAGLLFWKRRRHL